MANLIPSGFSGSGPNCNAYNSHQVSSNANAVLLEIDRVLNPQVSVNPAKLSLRKKTQEMQQNCFDKKSLAEAQRVNNLLASSKQLVSKIDQITSDNYIGTVIDDSAALAAQVMSTVKVDKKFLENVSKVNQVTNLKNPK